MIGLKTHLLLSFFSLFISNVGSEIVSLTHNQLPHESVDLKFLKIQDVNHSVLVDGLPVYFTCEIGILNKSLSIMFARRENANINVLPVTTDNSQSENNHQLKKYYESVHIKSLTNWNETIKIEANAILLLNLDTFQKLKLRTNKLEYLGALISNQNETNLSQFFNIFLSFQGLFGSEPVRIDLLHISSHNPDAELDENHPISIVNKRIPSFLNRNNYFPDSELHRISKRWIFKTDVTIKVCIHLIDSIFHATKKFLSTQNDDYVELFLSVIFSKSIANVNKAYESLKSRYLNFKVKLVELVIHKSPLGFVFGENEMKDLVNINQFVKGYYARQNASNRCDHVFFVHDKRFNHSLGMALVNSICSPNEKSSMNYYDLGNIDYIFAHELGHSVGAIHDTPSTCNQNHTIMWGSFNAHVSNFAFSTCTVRAFEESLIDTNTMKLKDKFRCLLQSENEKNPWFETSLVLVRKKLAGDFFSLSEQCRLLTNDSNSYVCKMEKRGNNACKEMGCANNGSCLNYIPLDGSPCGAMKFCYMFECVAMSRFSNKMGLLSEHEKAIDLMKNTCPAGLNQEGKARLVPNERFISIDYQGKPCGDVLFNMSVNLKKQELCENGLFALTCCDECLRYKLFQCTNSNRGCQTPASCENLASDPCFNGAKCVNKKKTENHSEFDLPFECKCKKGYTGQFCLKLDVCSLNPCNENKMCVSIGDLGQYTCIWASDRNSVLKNAFADTQILNVKRYIISICILCFILIASVGFIAMFFLTTNI